jgi:hypothetical protein
MGRCNHIAAFLYALEDYTLQFGYESLQLFNSGSFLPHKIFSSSLYLALPLLTQLTSLAIEAVIRQLRLLNHTDDSERNHLCYKIMNNSIVLKESHKY